MDRTTPQKLMVRCPKTGVAIPTGIVMAPETYASSGMQNNSTLCPACGQRHEWSKENTFWGAESLN